MNKNRVRYEQGFDFLQLTVTKKTKIKNLCLGTPDLVISQLSLSIKLAYMRNLNPAVYFKCKWFGWLC
jgi:hypothetical protein